MTNYLAKGAAGLEVWTGGAQSGVGQVHPVLDAHSDQIALAAGMRPVVMKERGD
jgi:hypothetical protein